MASIWRSGDIVCRQSRFECALETLLRIAESAVAYRRIIQNKCRWRFHLFVQWFETSHDSLMHVDSAVQMCGSVLCFDVELVLSYHKGGGGLIVYVKQTYVRT